MTAPNPTHFLIVGAGLRVGSRTQPLRHLIPSQLGESAFRQERPQFRVVETIAAGRPNKPVVDTVLEQQGAIGNEVPGAEKVALQG